MNGIANLLDKNCIEDILPLLPMQKNMLNSYLINQNPKLFNEINIYYLKGNIYPENLIKVWESIINENGILRTVFFWSNLSKPIQVILKEKDVNINIEYFNNPCEEMYEVRLEQIYNNLQSEMYDLTKTTLKIRFLIKDNENAMMIIAAHHIILDGWSNAELIREFKKKYEAFLSKKIYTNNKCTYSQVVKSYLQYSKSQDIEFWSHYLSDIKIKTLNTSIEKKENKRLIAQLPDYIYHAVHDYCIKNNYSISEIYYLVWILTIKIIEKKNDIYFGTTFSTRIEEISGMDTCMGLFINTLPFSIHLNDKERLSEVIYQIREILFQLQQRKSASMIDIFQKLEIKDFPEYPSIFVLQNYPIDINYLKNTSSLQIDIYKRLYKTNIDLNISIQCFQDIGIDIEYNPNKYLDKDVGNIYQTFIKAIQVISCSENEEISTIIARIFNNSCEVSKIGDFDL